MDKHYHVNAGLAGCLPSWSAAYRTKLAAIGGMVWFKRYCENGVEHRHELFTGDARKHGWYQACHPDALVDYVEIVPCRGAECGPVVKGPSSYQRGD